MTANLDCNSLYFGQFSLHNGLNNHNNTSSCKMEVSHPHTHSTNFSQMHQQSEIEPQRILISNNTYYGHHQVKLSPLFTTGETRSTDCEMRPISSHCATESPFGRKRSSDDVNASRIKRLKHEDTAIRSESKENVNWTNRRHKMAAPTLEEQLLEGIHGCVMSHILQEDSAL